ncbi:hypothetical protein N0V93_008360 [Gnomoniopsis smithogilvyi]|uniref:Uncharacterized protein n=1 Tax=Gnomoniopsis smithogilvyi TaxID=1191159 RepID=A0A9W8YLK0_9PEZI|nr:hypothetical protein N0V93_008360 [Gnomoniopsis smithogilvyi]
MEINNDQDHDAEMSSDSDHHVDQNDTIDSLDGALTARSRFQLSPDKQNLKSPRSSHSSCGLDTLNLPSGFHMTLPA